MQLEEPQGSDTTEAATPYDLMGGEAGGFALVERCDDWMDQTLEYYGILDH